MRIKDKVAIVTGGGRGIGRATALALAETGADVVITEIGYRSVNGTCGTPWDWQMEGEVDLDEQALCYRAALESLPGVGRKTANVVLNMWWGHPSQAVDTHIFRVGNRTGICPGKDVVAVERAIEDHIPVDFQHHAHHWLILHGRYVCTARNPACTRCGVRGFCLFFSKKSKL